MLNRFSRFVINVYKLLTSMSVTSMSVDVDTIKISLQCWLLGYGTISDEVIKDIDAANSISALLRMAMPFCSWYNYDLIALLAEVHGEERGKRLVSDYEEKIYLQRLVYQCPPFSALQSGKFSSELTVKVDWPYESCTLQDITFFKLKLCKALGLKDPSRFILKSVEEGCVRLTYIIPAQLVPELASKVEQATPKLVEEKVISIQVGMNPVISFLQVESGSYSDAKDQQEQILAVDVTPSYTDTGLHLALPKPHIVQFKAEAREQPATSPSSRRSSPAYETVAGNEFPTAHMCQLRLVRDSGISISLDIASEPPSQRNSVTSPMGDGHSYTVPEVAPKQPPQEIITSTHYLQEEDTTTSDGFSSMLLALAVSI